MNVIETFNISQNFVTSEGLIHLFEGLQWHSNLKELYIGY